MNYFIETLSKITLPKERFVERDYSTVEGEVFKGRQTNEGPSKYLMWSLAQKGFLFDKVIILVTNECIKENVLAVDNKTSYEYYIDSMKEYTEYLASKFDAIQNLLDEKYHGSVDIYINSVFGYVLIPSNPSKDDSRDIVNAIVPQNSIVRERIDLYLDFTGGSRIANLISLLLVRILEAVNAEVKKIVYGNILGDFSEIVDLTESYDLLISVENVAKAKSKESSREILEEFKKFGLATEEDIKDASQIDLKSKEAARNLKKLNDSKIKSDEKELDRLSAKSTGIVGAIKKEGAEKAKASNKASPFHKLWLMTDENLIINFYEELFGILYDLNVIFCTVTSLKPDKQKEVIKNTIKANDNYYITYNKRGEACAGVIPKLRNWLSGLIKNQQFDPIKNLQVKTRITSKEYDFIAERPFTKSINGILTDYFINYLHKNDIKIACDSQSDVFKEYSRLQRIYFNCGYPFMCMGTNNSEMFPEIAEYYSNKAQKLMESLSMLRKTNRDEYYNHLRDLVETPGKLEQEIPYMTKISVWEVNEKKFSSDDAIKEFITLICERVDRVRPYRNALAHKLVNEYSDLTGIKAIAEKIKEWISEYEKLFDNN